MRTPSPEAGLVYQLKITLLEIEPFIWRPFGFRRARPSKDSTRCSRRSWAGRTPISMSSRFGAADMACPSRMSPSTRSSLSGRSPCRKPRLQRASRSRYVYDLGDNWAHGIVVELIETPNKPFRYPACLAGARRCPPEDCGGPAGYAELLEIIGDPNHPEHGERLQWAGRRFDPEEFDLAALNRKLRLLK